MDLFLSFHQVVPVGRNLLPIMFIFFQKKIKEGQGKKTLPLRLYNHVLKF